MRSASCSHSHDSCRAIDVLVGVPRRRCFICLFFSCVNHSHQRFTRTLTDLPRSPPPVSLTLTIVLYHPFTLNRFSIFFAPLFMHVGVFCPLLLPLFFICLGTIHIRCHSRTQTPELNFIHERLRWQSGCSGSRFHFMRRHRIHPKCSSLGFPLQLRWVCGMGRLRLVFFCQLVDCCVHVCCQ